jgi:uncharacterized protein (TIGR02452 family)
LRAEIFKDTLNFVKSGYNNGNKHISIDNECIISEFFDKPEELIKQAASNTKFSVINSDCLEAAQLLLDSGSNPCVLNMASRQNPGGGVIDGAGAQEENLFRRTNLFMSLYQFTQYANEYGLEKSKYSYPLNRDSGGIYSGNITVFRASEKNGYRLLNNPFKLSFVSVPAINRPGLIEKNGLYFLTDQMVEPTKEKIRTILRISGKYKHDSLVLGAFGCGAFANPPNHMARLFKDVLTENEFIDFFKHIVFAIIDDHNSAKEHNPNGNILPFLEVFDAQ